MSSESGQTEKTWKREQDSQYPVRAVCVLEAWEVPQGCFKDKLRNSWKGRKLAIGIKMVNFKEGQKRAS